MSNNIYRIDYKLKEFDCRLEIIPAHDSNLASPNYINLDQNFIKSQIYKWETDKGFGLVAPTMEFEFDLNNCNNDLANVLVNFKTKHTDTWYPDEVFVPGWTGGKAESTINWNIQLYNIFIFYLKHPDSLTYQIVYAGLQQNGLDGNYKNGTLSIETVHLMKEVLSNYSTEYDREFHHYYTHTSRTAMFDTLHVASNSQLVGLFSPVDRTESDWWFWFGKVTDLNEYRNKILEYIYYRLTRAFTTWIGIDQPFELMQFYEQSYDETGATSTALNDTSLFFWNYYCKKDYDNYSSSDEMFEDGFLNKGIQEKYSNLWDYYVDLLDAYPRFGGLTEAGLTILPIYDALDANSKFINKFKFSEIQFDSPDLVNIARSSYVEKIADDNDKSEVKNTGNRSGNNYVIPIPHRTTITDDSKRQYDILSGWNKPAGIDFDSSVHYLGRTFQRRLFNIYYLGGDEIVINAEFPITEKKPIKVHNYVELKLDNNALTSNDIAPQTIINYGTEYGSPFAYDNAIVSDVHNRTGLGLHMADLVSKLYYSDNQNTIKGTIQLIELCDYSAPFIETGLFYSNNSQRKSYFFNPSNMNPVGKTLFTNYDDKYYVKSAQIDFADGNCEVTLISRGAYA